MLPNPDQNALSQGLSLEKITEAVRRSGYPLQSVVAAELQKSFVVTEEWGYPDRTQQEHRTLDVFAWKQFDMGNPNGIGVTPSLALQVECKRSSLPYVFFQSESLRPARLPEFPAIAGLQRLAVKSKHSSCEVTPSRCIGIESDPFICSGPPMCNSFARVAGKGDGLQSAKPDNKNGGSAKGFELTGSDAFNTILLPLAGALDHAREYYQPNIANMHPVILLSVCILDAPMILSRGGPEDPELTMTPWIRVIKMEKKKLTHGFLQRNYVFDFVHRFALPEFMARVIAFGEVVSERLIQKATFLKNGSAEVDDLDSWTWDRL